MIDIHTHVLPFVDDGSESLDGSIEMVKTAVMQGVTDIILTPHFRAPYLNDKDRLKESLQSFSREINNLGLNVNFYLGEEIRITKNYKELFSKNEILTMNGGKFVLIEFSFGHQTDIADVVYELSKRGFVPIVAHFERYYYVDVSTALEIKKAGGLIQVNASSVMGKNGFKIKRLTKRLFVRGLVDFVASDVHESRKYYMEKAYKKISKKFGEDVAENVFNNNAKMLIGG